jgi:hypothetical protein
MSGSDSGELEYAEYDGANEGEGDIRGDNAQSADHSHWRLPGSRRAALTFNINKAFPGKKVSVPAYPLCAPPKPGSPTWLKTREINALKSP